MADADFDYLKYIIRGDDLVINEKLKVRNLTLREITDVGESNYYNELSVLTLRPYDLMVMLYDSGHDFRTFDDFLLFATVCPVSLEKPSILLPGVQFSAMKLGTNPSSGDPILYDPGTSLIIDKPMYLRIVQFLRKTNYITSTKRIDPGGEFAYRELIRQERRKLNKKKQRTGDNNSHLPNIISSLVNSTGFKYNYDTVFDLHIGQLFDAFYRTNKIQSVNHIMDGIYAGTVDQKKINKDNLSWYSPIDVDKPWQANENDKSNILTPTMKAS